jgi:hypothetical protein
VWETNVSIVEQALMQWRRCRQNASAQRESTIEAWLAALHCVLAEHGLRATSLREILGEDPREYVEQEYAAWAEKTR